MLASFYIEIDLVFIIILCCLIYRTHKSNLTEINKTHFTVLLICSLLFACSDLVWVFNNNYINLGIFGDFGIVLSNILNNLNIIISGMTGLSWLFFSESVQGNTFFNKNKKIYIALIPELILIFICLINHRTHFMFTISEHGEYTRGIGYAFQVLVGYGYIVFAVILSLRRAKRATTEIERKTALSMSSYMIAPFIAFLLQIVFNNMPLLFIGTVISLLNIFMSLQQQLVLNDALTGLNNRARLDQMINYRIKNLDDKTDFWLLMFDANKFKSINDTYGHLEGDRALILIADALKKKCKAGDFICRYGGDEFVVLASVTKGSGCPNLREYVNEYLAQIDLPYDLQVGAGSAMYLPDIKDWSELIRRADEELYKNKRH